MNNPVDYQLPGTFIEVLKTRPESEINEIFNALVAKKLAEIPGCQTTEDLIRIQAQAKYCQELHAFFLNEMNRR